MPAKRYVLDSYALLMLEDEPGADRVGEVILSSRNTVFMRVINLGEVDLRS